MNADEPGVSDRRRNERVWIHVTGKEGTEPGHQVPDLHVVGRAVSGSRDHVAFAPVGSGQHLIFAAGHELVDFADEPFRQRLVALSNRLHPVECIGQILCRQQVTQRPAADREPVSNDDLGLGQRQRAAFDGIGVVDVLRPEPTPQALECHLWQRVRPRSLDSTGQLGQPVACIGPRERMLSPLWWKQRAISH